MAFGGWATRPCGALRLGEQLDLKIYLSVRARTDEHGCLDGDKLAGPTLCMALTLAPGCTGMPVELAGKLMPAGAAHGGAVLSGRPGAAVPGWRLTGHGSSGAAVVCAANPGSLPQGPYFPDTSTSVSLSWCAVLALALANQGDLLNCTYTSAARPPARGTRIRQHRLGGSAWTRLYARPGGKAILSHEDPASVHTCRQVELSRFTPGRLSHAKKQDTFVCLRTLRAAEHRPLGK